MRFWSTVVALLLAGTAAAQMRNPDETISAGENAGSLSDVSGPLRDDSVPVSGSGTIGELSVGTMRSGPVSGFDSRSMRSGPVSDASVGPMREPRPPVTTGSMTEWSAGAVKQNVTDPLGTQISEPIRELRPLQAAMRAQREQAEADALTGVPAAVLSPDEAAAMQQEANRAAEDQFDQLEPAGDEPAAGIEPAEEPPADAADPEDNAVEQPAEHDADAIEPPDEAPAGEATPQ
jgi:hypothetical protein